MVLDDELLDKARTAGARVAEAEKQVLVARADYHTYVRRLHLAGAPLREIAQALALSHQRVQQIVQGAGGSWWSRAWRTRKPTPDMVCTFCGRPPGEVKKLVAGPEVYVCDGCIARARKTLADRAPSGAPQLTRAAERARVTCSFCGKARAAGREIACADQARVCEECLAICEDIVRG
jgi:hypothetical protein